MSDENLFLSFFKEYLKIDFDGYSLAIYYCYAFFLNILFSSYVLYENEMQNQSNGMRNEHKLL
jgi:hypothetical protein